MGGVGTRTRAARPTRRAWRGVLLGHPRRRGIGFDARSRRAALGLRVQIRRRAAHHQVHARGAGRFETATPSRDLSGRERLHTGRPHRSACVAERGETGRVAPRLSLARISQASHIIGMSEKLEMRVYGDAALPTLIYLPGIHGDWTLRWGARRVL